MYSLDKMEPPAYQFVMSLYVKKENDRNGPRDRFWFSEVMFRAWEKEAARVKVFVFPFTNAIRSKP